VGFQIIITHLEFDIITTAPTLHRTTISDENLVIRKRVDKVIGLFNKPAMNKIMGDTTINQHHNWPMFDVALDIQCLWGQNTQEGMKRYENFLWCHNIIFNMNTWLSILFVRSLI
jgi:hypothetical protein